MDNIIHIVINNGAHDSVGAESPMTNSLSLSSIAKSCNYKHVYRVLDVQELKIALDDIFNKRGSRFLEIICKRGARDDLGRPTQSPQKNKEELMFYLNKEGL